MIIKYYLCQKVLFVVCDCWKCGCVDNKINFFKELRIVYFYYFFYYNLYDLTKLDCYFYRGDL